MSRGSSGENGKIKTGNSVHAERRSILESEHVFHREKMNREETFFDIHLRHNFQRIIRGMFPGFLQYIIVKKTT